MGKELKNLYDQILEKYGQIALYRLVIRTRISSTEVGSIPDSPDKLDLVKKAIEELNFITAKESTIHKKNRWWNRILK